MVTVQAPPSDESSHTASPARVGGLSRAEILTLAASAPPLPPGVSEADDTVLYPIFGNTGDAIRVQLHVEDASTTDSDFVGYTAARFEWRFRPQRDTARRVCVLRGVHVSLVVTTTLPVWRPAPTPPPSHSLVGQWTQFLSATERHELGHLNIARRTAADLYEHLASLTRATCEALSATASSTAHALWVAGHERQLAYDLATRHGETQGTTWPP